MIHAPNTIEWRPGDLVLHDDDAKRPDMLMVVLGRIKTGPNKGKYRTRYHNTNGSGSRAPMHQYRRTIWTNDIGRLHDPRRFGIRILDCDFYEVTADGHARIRNFTG
ncbi:MAG: hypothetical protein JWP34_4739 [Massilia sp.]|nr:hypothetical protein [Massilia sp.]